MSEIKESRSRSRRLNAGELIALRLLLRNVDESISSAIDAPDAATRRESLKVAQNNARTAIELAKD